jgi:hypothetical protein
MTTTKTTTTTTNSFLSGVLKFDIIADLESHLEDDNSNEFCREFSLIRLPAPILGVGHLNLFTTDSGERSDIPQLDGQNPTRRFVKSKVGPSAKLITLNASINQTIINSDSAFFPSPLGYVRIPRASVLFDVSLQKLKSKFG